ncbi:hypothetical protein Tco_0657106 [Tanacetum coccineum]|uniref:Uncharacterized protein n=1 Tax=Tanacetum coccineum TaxID=301880 RepID=A0ABQ4XBZ0_9ASTR
MTSGALRFEEILGWLKGLTSNSYGFEEKYLVEQLDKPKIAKRNTPLGLPIRNLISKSLDSDDGNLVINDFFSDWDEVKKGKFRGLVPIKQEDKFKESDLDCDSRPVWNWHSKSMRLEKQEDMCTTEVNGSSYVRGCSMRIGGSSDMNNRLISKDVVNDFGKIKIQTRKSRRDAKLLLAELNEVQERNEDLLEELSKTIMERDSAEFAKNQLRQGFSKIYNLLDDVLPKDLDYLYNLDANVKSLLESSDTSDAGGQTLNSSHGSIRSRSTSKRKQNIYVTCEGFLWMAACSMLEILKRLSDGTERQPRERKPSSSEFQGVPDDKLKQARFEIDKLEDHKEQLQLGLDVRVAANEDDIARILRGLRIAARLGLSFSKDIEAAIHRQAPFLLNLAMVLFPNFSSTIVGVFDK